MRTSGPRLPSGRRFASTGQAAWAQICIMRAAIVCESARSSILCADEDDVDVADIVELPAAALTHGDDGEPGRGCTLGLGESQAALIVASASRDSRAMLTSTSTAWVRSAAAIRSRALR